MLDHDRLLNRTTELFGLSGLVIDWLESYLTSCWSSAVYCRTGLPQFLGLLGRQVLCVYHTCHSSHLYMQRVMSPICRWHTVVYIHWPTMTLTTCADAVTRWHLDNNLLLNPQRTEALLTGTRQQVVKFENSSSFANTVVPCSKSVRVLGVTIDSQFDFWQTCTNVVQSCNYHIPGCFVCLE